MRKGRVTGMGASNYHVFSRVVNRERVFDSKERDRFARLMRRVERFCGVKVLTYTILSNHFHILLHVPKRRDLSDRQLVRRLACLYSGREVRRVQTALRRFRESGNDEAAETLKAAYTYRMCNLSEFCKTLLQRFSQSYNSRHDRTGTLWGERFGSLMLVGSSYGLSAVAAYIDLNAVRAGLVRDPVDYPWCGYAEAVGGSSVARAGLGLVMLSLGRGARWGKTAGRYRQLLYLAGRARGCGPRGLPSRPGYSPEEVQSVLDAGGKLPLNVVLRCRVRYFTRGLVLGSHASVEDALRRYGNRISSCAAVRPCGMAGSDWGDLYVGRVLQGEAITVPIGKRS